MFAKRCQPGPVLPGLLPPREAAEKYIVHRTRAAAFEVVGEFRSDFVDNLHVLELGRELAALSASAPRASANVGVRESGATPGSDR